MKKYVITEIEIQAILHYLKIHSTIPIKDILNELEELKENEHTQIQEENKTG